MTCVPRPTYDELGEELIHDLTLAIEAFAAKRGLTYDQRAYHAQCQSREEALHELLGFGLDVWPAGVGDPEGEPHNVVSFEKVVAQAARPEKRTIPAVAAALVMALGVGATLMPAAAEAQDVIPAFSGPLP